MWIARDKDGETYLYKNYPIKHNDYFSDNNGEYNIYLGNDVYPELNWENSPKKVELKIIEENATVAESPSKTFPIVNEFETGANYRH